MNILVVNPGGNSLKAQLVQCRVGQQNAFEGQKLLSVSIEGIGKKPELAVMRDKKKTAREPIEAKDVERAAANFVKWWEKFLPTIDSHRYRVST